MRLLQMVSLLALAILLAGATRTVSDTHHTFSVHVPSGWSCTDEGNVLRLVAPPRCPHVGFRGNVGIEVMDATTSLTPARKKEFRDELHGLVPKLKISGESDATIDGAPGWKITYNGVTHNVRILGCSIVLYRDHHTWIFTFLTSEEKWPQDKADADEVLSSFTIL
ncbi:MAG: PsbP-related protein [Candidatus Xenobia bacterium]